MKCKKHPKYKAKYPPRCQCEKCWDIYNKKIGEQYETVAKSS